MSKESAPQPQNTPDADFERFSSETTPEMIADQFHGARDSWASQLRKNKAERETAALQEHYDKRAEAKKGLKKNSEIKSFKDRMNATEMVYRNAYNRDIRQADEAIANYQDVSGPEDARATDMLKQLEEDWARVGGDRYDAAKERVAKYRSLKDRMLAKQALKAIGEELVRNMYSEFVAPRLQAQDAPASAEVAPAAADAEPATPEKAADKKQEFMAALDQKLSEIVKKDSARGGIFDEEWKNGKLERAAAMDIALSKLTPEEMADKFANVDRNDEKYLQAGGMWDDDVVGSAVTPAEKPAKAVTKEKGDNEFPIGSSVVIRNDDGSIEDGWIIDGEPRVSDMGETWIHMSKRTESGSLIRKGVPIDELREMQLEASGDDDDDSSELDEDDYGMAVTPGAVPPKPRVGAIGDSPAPRSDDTPAKPKVGVPGAAPAAAPDKAPQTGDTSDSAISDQDIDRLYPQDIARLRRENKDFDLSSVSYAPTEDWPQLHQEWIRVMAAERARRDRMANAMDLAAQQLVGANRDSSGERPLSFADRIAYIRSRAARARRRFDGRGSKLLNRVRESNGGPMGNNPPREQSVAAALWNLYNQVRVERAADGYMEQVVDNEYLGNTRKKKIAKAAMKSINKWSKDLKKRQRRSGRR